MGSLTLTFSGFIQLFKKSKLTHFRRLGMGKLGVFATCLMMVVLLQVLTVDQTSANNELEDNVLRDFYEYLMQREAVEAGSHQLERRARPYQSAKVRETICIRRRGELKLCLRDLATLSVLPVIM